METVLVCAGIVRRGEEVLIAQRKAGGLQGGLWEFPGGKVEIGEDPRTALARELHEELGIEVRVGPIYEASSHIYGERHVVLLAFLCDLAAGEPEPLDCAAFTWAPPERLGEFEFAPADLPFVERLKAAVSL